MQPARFTFPYGFTGMIPSSEIGEQALFISTLLAALSPSFASAAMASPEVIGCTGDWTKILEAIKPLEPKPAGPMRLSASRCLPIVHGRDPVYPSPDGRKAFTSHAIDGLWVGSVDRAGANYTFPLHGFTSLWTPTVPFEWLPDSSAVLGVAQDKDRSGFALGGLQPYLFTETGGQTPLPVLTHPNGPLDDIFWIGGTGLAFATFGTRGSYYRPEHEDPHPTIALVDAKAGRVLDAVEIATIPTPPDYRHFVAASSRVDRSGRVRVLTAWRPDIWMLWDQGEKPRILPIHNKIKHPRYTLSMDGNKVLIMGNLSATGLICEFGNPCPPPTPQSGMIAELREVVSGRLIWSITGKADDFSISRVPAISPDDRYALITMQSEKEYVALVSMTDGSVLQRFEMPGWASPTLGFSPDSKEAWITGGSVMATFTIGTQQ
ncbi:hypothetical protein PH563_31700 [Rhizobium phaseoli]|nr:hypothetical protein [Rhizobium phaseoli]MDK4730454.1 hypothetical protein [Rhizobium phaseoli]